MKTIHPFPARMAPGTISKWLKKLPEGSKVLDPMCGSGVVVRQALMHGHDAYGLDLDPLAVLMTKVWTRTTSANSARRHAEQIVDQMKQMRSADRHLPWVDGCDETAKFVEFWFAEPQRTDLGKLSTLLIDRPKGRSQAVNDLLQLALSKTIITKQVGASLAWDVSHSRPHKMRDTNDFDVKTGFLKAVNSIIRVLENDPVHAAGKVYRGDTRSSKRLVTSDMDAVITSPPYLNAIDYLRGHKLSLVWLGYTIPALRALRSTTIGTERGTEPDKLVHANWKKIQKAVPEIDLLPARRQRMVARYAEDAAQLLGELKRVIRPGGQMILVLGDCTIKGQFIQNSKIYHTIAKQLGFRRTEQKKRELDLGRRYLPVTSSNNSLEKRMRHEIIQVYRAAA